MTSNMKKLIVDNYVRAYEQLGKWSGMFSFIRNERIQRCESNSNISFGLINSVLTYNRSETQDLNAEIKNIVELYAEKGQELFWLTYSHEADDIIEMALRANQFRPIEVMTGFGLSLESWSSNQYMDGFEIQPVRSEADLETYRKIVLAGFEIPKNLEDIFSKIFVDAPNQDKSFQHYIGYLNDEPVTGITSFIEGSNVGIYNVATPAVHRRKGYARTALAHVLHDVKKQGVQQAIIIATPMAASVYPAVGFKEELTINIFSK